MDIVYQKKTVLNASFQDFWCTNINNHLSCFEKTINTYSKAKNSLNTTRISRIKYVFIVFFEKKSDAKIFDLFLGGWIQRGKSDLLSQRNLYTECQSIV